jgi:hypothetical protein
MKETITGRALLPPEEKTFGLEFEEELLSDGSFWSSLSFCQPCGRIPKLPLHLGSNSHQELYGSAPGRSTLLTRGKQFEAYTRNAGLPLAPTSRAGASGVQAPASTTSYARNRDSTPEAAQGVDK